MVFKLFGFKQDDFKSHAIEYICDAIYHGKISSKDLEHLVGALKSRIYYENELIDRSEFNEVIIAVSKHILTISSMKKEFKSILTKLNTDEVSLADCKEILAEVSRICRGVVNKTFYDTIIDSNAISLLHEEELLFMLAIVSNVKELIPIKSTGIDFDSMITFGESEVKLEFTYDNQSDKLGVRSKLSNVMYNAIKNSKHVSYSSKVINNRFIYTLSATVKSKYNRNHKFNSTVDVMTVYSASLKSLAEVLMYISRDYR